VCIYLAINLIFTGQCTILGHFTLINMLGENGHPKYPKLKFVSLCFRTKRQKPVANFFICQDGKMATQKPTTQIYVAFALRTKATEKPFKELF